MDEPNLEGLLVETETTTALSEARDHGAPSGDKVTEVPTGASLSETEGASRRLVFLVCAIALFMGSIDSTIVSTALRTITHDLHATINWAAWTITVYQLGQLLAMPLAGKISDQFGRKRVFVAAVVLFTAASLACSFATSIYLLVVLRGIQAIGGGAFMPSATGIVSDHFGRDRDKAIGMFTSIFPIGAIIGPIFGGVFVTYWTWRGIFIINVPIGIVLVVMALRVIPDVRPVRSERTDAVGVLLLGGVLLAAMFAITILGSTGRSPTDPLFVGPLLGSVGIGYLFVRHTNRHPAPFIPMRLLRGRGFAMMNVVNFFFGICAFGFGALVPLYATNRYHISILDSGTLLTARGLGMMSVSAVAALMLRRTGYRLPMALGFTSLAIGLVGMSIAPPWGLSPYLWLAVFAALTGVAMGMAAPATNNATLHLAPDQIAAIAGLRGMFRGAGGIFAISIATAVLNRSADPGFAQAHIFWATSVILLVVMIPLTFSVPDHKGSW